MAAARRHGENLGKSQPSCLDWSASHQNPKHRPADSRVHQDSSLDYLPRSTIGAALQQSALVARRHRAHEKPARGAFRNVERPGGRASVDPLHGGIRAWGRRPASSRQERLNGGYVAYGAGGLGHHKPRHSSDQTAPKAADSWVRVPNPSRYCRGRGGGGGGGGRRGGGGGGGGGAT